MTGKHWMTTTIIAALALAGCVEQEPADDLELDAGPDTAAMAPEAAPEIDTTSTDLATWNTDADARLGSNEFNTWLEERDFHSSWNTDGTEGLTPDELAAGLIDVMDGNGDGSVGEDDWSAGGAWVGEAAFADVDADGNGSIDQAELASGLRDGAGWAEWDQDGNGTLDRTEFHAAVFNAWDANDDEFVDETEWRDNFDSWS